MHISITELKQRFLEIMRRVERTGKPVGITRHGRVVAELRRPAKQAAMLAKPWKRLRATGGHLIASPDESVLKDEDFEAMR
jgi:prevent-host-death family protein